jgi:hypothetical protein
MLLLTAYLLEVDIGRKTLCFHQSEDPVQESEENGDSQRDGLQILVHVIARHHLAKLKTKVNSAGNEQQVPLPPKQDNNRSQKRTISQELSNESKI